MNFGASDHMHLQALYATSYEKQIKSVFLLL